MYNLIEYSDSYSKTSGSLWQYFKDIPAVNNNNSMVDFAVNNLTDSFNFEVKITGQTGNNEKKEVEIMVSLKYINNLWRTLEMPLIMVSTNAANQGTTFPITETKLYIPVGTSSTQDNAKLLQQFKSCFKRAINWNKYTSKAELLRQNRNLNHLVEPIF